MLWQRAWNLFTKSPLFGIGFARFTNIFSIFDENLAGYHGILSVYLNPRFYYGFNNAHNSYLQFLAETGIIGLGLMLFFWCLCFQIIFKAFNKSGDSFSRRAFLAGLSSIILLFVLAFTENYLSSTTIMIGSSMIVSLCIGLAWQERNRNTSL